MKPEYRRRRVNWMIALLGVLIALIVPAGLATAHSTTVTSSDPGDGAILAHSPAQVKAAFADELVTKSSTMIVLDADGKQVSEGQGKVDLNDPDHASMLALLPAPLPDGAYTVRWHALLTDGDTTDGAFKFAIRVGAPPELATPPATAQPTATPTPAPTSRPLPTVPAGPAAEAPNDLSLTGARAYRVVSWLVAGTILILGGLGLILTLRSTAR